MQNNLFFDTRARSDCPFQVFVGGRGIGKTYSSLKNTRIDENGEFIKPCRNSKFIYMRRMSKEIEMCTSAISNPFKRINADCNTDVYAEYIKRDGYAIFYDGIFIDADNPPMPIGYGVALSTFAGLRGVDFSDVNLIIFDEFIPERHVRKIKDEGKVFLNMYETVNRNRELFGEPPVKVLLLANSISLASQILLEIKAVPTMASMIMKGQHRATIKERGLYIEIIDSTAIGEKKMQTALYKLTSGTDFSKEAIMNQFTNDNLNLAKKVVINEYKPIFTFNGNYTYYKHKSREEYYLANRFDTASVAYSGADIDQLQASFSYAYERLVLSRKLFFDDYATKLVFDTILNIK